MYERFYGLRERPFDLTPNPKYLYLTRKHQDALSTLYYGVFGRKGVIVITGQAGTGKTTLIHATFDSPRGLPDRVVRLNNPTLSRQEFFEWLAHAFGLPAGIGRSKSRTIVELTRSIQARRARGGVTALIVDEAQCLSDELLEEVRLLANIETTDEKLLPLVLTGQPQLGERLNQPSLQQLKQRVALRCAIEPLTLKETAAYITVRVWVAGGSRKELFTRDAVETIYEISGGIPRTISVICDNALIYGFVKDERPVRQQTVLEVCGDMDIQAGTAQPVWHGRLASVPAGALARQADLASLRRVPAGAPTAEAMALQAAG